MRDGSKMKNIRLIARLDIKGSNLVKGIQFEGLRKIGNPNKFAKQYYEQGIDEILYIDIVASLYNRNNLSDIVMGCTKDVFVPITVGGGIRNIKDVNKLLHCGADKIAINTGAIKKPELIQEVSNQYGSQCMVLSIQAKKIAEGKWEAYYDNGREKTGIDVIEWAKKGYQLGAGEILLTSVDKDGTKKGFDLELIRSVSDAVPIPVIASGGMGNPQDFLKVVLEGHADAVAVASLLHYGKNSVTSLKTQALLDGISVREDEGVNGKED